MTMRKSWSALALAALLVCPAAATAEGPPPFTARSGEDLARDAAAAWAEDARLIYVENDEPVLPTGDAGRWGYLFYSPSLDAARAYSVLGGKIRTASDVSFDFAAPPLPVEWIDSGQALEAAEKKGRDYRENHAGEVRSMFLVRGLLHPEDPDVPTWAVVYDSPTTSGLWVVVDARTGKVVKTWRG